MTGNHPSLAESFDPAQRLYLSNELGYPFASMGANVPHPQLDQRRILS